MRALFLSALLALIPSIAFAGGGGEEDLVGVAMILALLFTFVAGWIYTALLLDTFKRMKRDPDLTFKEAWRSASRASQS